MVIVGRSEPGLDIVERCGRIAEIRLLRQITDGGARLHESPARIGLDRPGRNLEQRRFARSVAANEADPLARFDGEFRAGEQRLAAERERDIAELKQRGHGTGIYRLPLVTARLSQR
jgi:hypothetical protein